MRSLQQLLDALRIPLHLAGLFAMEIRLPVCTCKGSLRAVGFCCNTGESAEGAGINRTVKSLLHFSWLRGRCGMCWAGILH